MHLELAVLLVGTPTSLVRCHVMSTGWSVLLGSGKTMFVVMVATTYCVNNSSSGSNTKQPKGIIAQVVS